MGAESPAESMPDSILVETSKERDLIRSTRGHSVVARQHGARAAHDPWFGHRSMAVWSELPARST